MNTRRAVPALLGLSLVALVAYASAGRGAQPAPPRAAGKPLPSTRPLRPVGARILDSVHYAGRPVVLHRTRHMRKAVTPTGSQMTSLRAYDHAAIAMRRQGGVATLDQEILPAGDGSALPAVGWPTGHEPAAEFEQIIGHHLWGIDQIRKRLGPDWPIGVYAFLPRASFYPPYRRAAFEDASLDGTPHAWMRDRNNQEVKWHALEGWENWRKGNDRIAAASLDRLDFLCPQLYAFDDDLRVWDWLLKGNMDEAQRLARGRPIYPFLMPTYFEVDNNPRGGQPVKYATFKHWLTTTLKATDGKEGRPEGGVVVWGFSPHPWDPNAGWLRALREVCDELDAAGPPAPVTRPAAPAGRRG